MAKQVLVATVKPFAPSAVQSIKKITEDNGYEFRLLEKYEDESVLKEAVSTADALIIRSDKIHSGIIEASDTLKVIVRAGAGYDNVDLKAASDKGIIVMNTPGQNSNAVAELALGMMVYMCRNGYNGKAGVELRDKTIGIHAYGNVGRYVADIAKGFGMKVFAFDPFIRSEDIEKDGVTPLESVEELYSKCQYISLHIPSNEKTNNSINSSLLSLMPQNGVLVNTARKEVVCEESLVKILRERDDFKYISDIAPDCREELEKDYADRVFFTPKKMGAQTSEANVNAGIAAINQISAYFEKGDTGFQVNK